MLKRSLVFLVPALVAIGCGKSDFIGSLKGPSMCVNYTALGDYKDSSIATTKRMLKATAGKNWSDEPCSLASAKGVCTTENDNGNATVEMKMYAYDDKTAEQIKASCDGSYTAF